MANNVYIGNRYVPVFANPVEWNNLREYEPLTIVTYQGTAYTSRQTVPVGTELSNRDYWVVTGNYNAQVEAYRQEVENTKTELENSITNATTKKFVFIGDSYCDPNLGGFANGIATIPMEMVNQLGWTAYIYEKGGAGFTGNSQGKTFSDLLDDAITDHGSEKITNIVVMGGCNESTVQTELNNAIDTFVNKAVATWPNVLICMAMVGGRWGQMGEFQLPRYLYNFHRQNTTCISNAYLPMRNTGYFSDNVHPNNLGVRTIGSLIATAIVGNSIVGYAEGFNVPSSENINLLLKDGSYKNINMYLTTDSYLIPGNQSITFVSVPTTTSGRAYDGEVALLQRGHNGINLGTISGLASIDNSTYVPAILKIVDSDTSDANLNVILHTYGAFNAASSVIAFYPNQQNIM